MHNGKSHTSGYTEEERRNNGFLHPVGYTDEERRRILEVLLLNNLNISKTSREVGVPRNTLTKWYKQYGGAMNSLSTDLAIRDMEVIDTEEVIGSLISDRHQRLMENITILQEVIVKRLKIIVPVSNNPESLAKALKWLYDIQISNKAEGFNEGISDTQEFIKIVQDQVNKNKNGSKTD